MNENEFLNWILDVAAVNQWRAWHVPAPMRFVGKGKPPVPETRAAGLPDLILLHHDPARLIFAEVKGTDGSLSDAQATFLSMARHVTDAFSATLHAASEVIRSAGVVYDLDVRPPVGVYLWRPGMEELIEATLRSKVMTR